MNHYKFSLHDYHAIKDTEINLDGITVLSGINGCGKSTLSRWLYYTVNGIAHYEDSTFSHYRRILHKWVSSYRFAFTDIEHYINSTNNTNIDIINRLHTMERQLLPYAYVSPEQINEMRAKCMDVIFFVKEILMDEQIHQMPHPRLNRILRFLKIESDGSDYQGSIADYIDKQMRYINRLANQLYDELKTRPADNFFANIEVDYNIEEDTPEDIQLEEDGVRVFEGEHISTLLGLNKAIYIDTPMSITADVSDNPFWTALQQLLLTEKKNVSPTSRLLLQRIKMLLHGEAVLTKDEVLDERTLRFVSSDRAINIDLSQAATGYKTLVYLQRLLEIGCLDDKTLLLIDEPEAHLHPQWIVEFAHLLVLLHKELGIKIMLASHNPDMVAAIQAVAAKEGVRNATHFYVAEPVADHSHQYVYRDLGFEIEDIFESFNIAIERIEAYGAIDI